MDRLLSFVARRAGQASRRHARGGIARFVGGHAGRHRMCNLGRRVDYIGAPRSSVDESAVLALVEEICDPALLHDGARITGANGGAAELWGGKLESLVGRALADLFPDDRSALAGRGDQGLARRRACVLVRAGGERHQVQVSEIPLSDRGRVAFVIVLRDPDVGRVSVQAIAALEKMRTAALLSAGLAHEVNNLLLPLNSALDALIGLGGGIDRPEDRARELALAGEAALALTLLVRDFHGYARSDPRSISEPSDARAAVERAVRLARTPLRGVGTVDLKLEEVPAVRTVGSAITQIALNLLLNAADALDACDRTTSRIEVRLSQRGDHVLLEVEDNGCGISPAVEGRLFEPLVTSKMAADPSMTGSAGFGLAVCRQVARGVGGDIGVSVGAGGGTTFRVVLPLAVPPVG